jgi:ABC-type nitrate/sulfonate/bicarbonate transport system permease component
MTLAPARFAAPDRVPKARSGRGRTIVRAQASVLAQRVALGVALVGAWSLLSHSGWVKPLYISSPSATWNAFVSLTRSGVMFSNLSATLQETVIGFVIGSAAGIAIGLGLGMAPAVERVVDPYISALNSLPRIALAPLFVIFFGIGPTSKVALAVSLVVFVLVLNTRAGVKGADRDIVLLTRSLDATRWQLFYKVLLPIAVPSIFAGLRLAVIYSLLGVVTGEMIAARKGVGQLIVLYSGTFDMASVYAILFVLAVVASLMNGLMGWLERRLLRWQRDATS